ncbi:hypothetical protein MMC24_002553, partial [Lignoscripta atroalba]|nr:hypothetical protein [Lignoscripta atroalba]
MTCFGTWTILGTYRIVRTITALPPKSGAVPTPLLLRIENARMLPGFRPKAVSVPHNTVVLSAQLLASEMKLRPVELAEVRQQQAKMREIEKSRILTMPFRQASYWLWKAFEGLKRIWSKDGFIYIRIKGRNGTWKLDRNAAWALDDGRALDRL